MPTQADLLDKQIKELEVENPDSPTLAFMKTQRDYLRRVERQFAGLERERPNPCGNGR